MANTRDVAGERSRRNVGEMGPFLCIFFLLFNRTNVLYVQDVHARYKTEAHQDVCARFNERWVDFFFFFFLIFTSRLVEMWLTH